VNFRPGKKTGSSAATIAAFLEVVEREVPGDTDIILLPEGMTVVGTGQKYADVAEPVSGPVTEKLGTAAGRAGSALNPRQ
jgi:predicted amidohydrolase